MRVEAHLGYVSAAGLATGDQLHEICGLGLLTGSDLGLRLLSSFEVKLGVGWHCTAFFKAKSLVKQLR